MFPFYLIFLILPTANMHIKVQELASRIIDMKKQKRASIISFRKQKANWKKSTPRPVSTAWKWKWDFYPEEKKTEPRSLSA